MKLKSALENTQLNYATFNRRIYAMTIDVFIFILVASPLMNLATYMIMGDLNIVQIMNEIDPSSMNAQVSLDEFLDQMIKYKFFYRYSALISIMLVLLFIWEMYFWVKFNSTPGKMICACKFVDDKTGNSPSRKQYLMRFFGYFLSTIPLYLGFFAMCWSKKKQSWHDKFSNIAVVTVPRDYTMFERFRTKVKSSI